ncbi:hypothetical protein LCGC14_0951630 [marine sediment metagenome]|uniref:Uncharacterized protein n=1 Tax=marine sediment metagenome TaxID=412755 RepID=A0A0F9NLT8_9ZZZZ
MSEEFNYQSSTVNIGVTKVALVTGDIAPDTDLQVAANACKRCLIKAFTTNTGLIWVDFGQAAVDLDCYPIAAGETISVPLTNTDRIHMLAKIVNNKIAVVYSN